MIREWFNAREAAELGVSLADQFAPPRAIGPGAHDKGQPTGEAGGLLPEILQRVDREVRGLRLNFYKRAKFANSFKWRLLDNGVDKGMADEVTQRLVLHLSGNQLPSAQGHDADVMGPGGSQPNDAKHLLALGNRSMAEGAYAEAIAFYQDLIKLNPRHAVALNNLGSALFKVGRYKEAEGRFSQAIKVAADYPDPHGNLGTLHSTERRLRRGRKIVTLRAQVKPAFRGCEDHPWVDPRQLQEPARSQGLSLKRY